MLSRYSARCKRLDLRPIRTNNRRPESRQRVAQTAFRHGRHTLGEIRPLGVAQGPRWRRLAFGLDRRTLDEGNARDRAIAEKTIDTLDENRLEVLGLDGKGRSDAQPQGTADALAAREAQAIGGKLRR